MKKATYESALAEVQSIVNELQEETVSMDDLSKKVARAAELIQYCREKLRATEQQVNSVFEWIWRNLLKKWLYFYFFAFFENQT